MSTPWNNLYLNVDAPSERALSDVTDALLAALIGEGYTRYDPFAGGNGTPPGLKIFNKLFVLPLEAPWLRITGALDRAAALKLSARYRLLRGWLDESGGGWEVLQAGAAADDPAAFAPFLRPDVGVDEFRRAQAGDVPLPRVETGGALPPDIQRLAESRQINPRQADRMVNRVTAQLFGRLDRESGGEASAMQHQARTLAGGGGLDWNGAAGRRVRAVRSLLAIPSSKNEPSWEDIRDAYQTARILTRNPKASLLPGEREALAAIPGAARFSAIYVGR